MLRLINPPKHLPTNYIVDPACPDFEPGQIGEVYISSAGLRLCRPYSGGSGSIVGIIDDVKNATAGNSTASTGRITTWSHHGIFETDQYDISSIYHCGSRLYADPYIAKLTTTAPPSLKWPFVAVVITPPAAQTPLLKFEWLAGNYGNAVALSQAITQTIKGRVLSIPGTVNITPKSQSGPAQCKCGYTNEYVDPSRPYECYKCRNKI